MQDPGASGGLVGAWLLGEKEGVLGVLCGSHPGSSQLCGPSARAVNLQALLGASEKLFDKGAVWSEIS